MRLLPDFLNAVFNIVLLMVLYVSSLSVALKEGTNNPTRKSIPTSKSFRLILPGFFKAFQILDIIFSDFTPIVFKKRIIDERDIIPIASESLTGLFSQ